MGKNFKMKRILYLLIFTNIITLGGLFFISSAQKADTKVQSHSKVTHVYNSKRYKARRSTIQQYKTNTIKFVMLGDSITYRNDWNKLLSRHDIANFGIDGDITEGFLHRLEDVYALTPEFCFIMGGINDIARGVVVKDIFDNYSKIIQNLQKHHIVPIIQSTLYLSKKRQNWKILNLKVDALNRALEEYAVDNAITFIDTNKALSQHRALSLSYTGDGVHLLSNAYRKWGEILVKNFHEK